MIFLADSIEFILNAEDGYINLLLLHRRVACYRLFFLTYPI